MRTKKVLATILVLCMAFALITTSCGQQPSTDSASTVSTTQDTTMASATATATVTATATETPKQSYSLKYASGMTADHPQVVAAMKFADEVSDLSDGRITIKIFHSGQLGGEKEMHDMVRDGTVDMIDANLTFTSNYYEAAQVFSLPFIFKSYDDVKKYMTESEFSKDFWGDTIQNALNVHFMGMIPCGSRCLTTKGVEVNSPADLKDIKIRSMEPPVSRFMIRSLGAEPMPIAFSELYMALQTGVVQGQENPISIIYANKFYEVQDYLMLTEHVYNNVVIYMNQDRWASFDEEDQALIAKAFKDTMQDTYNDDYYSYEDDALFIMKAKGINVIEKDALDMDAFRANASALINAEYGTNQAWMDQLDDINTFLKY